MALSTTTCEYTWKFFLAFVGTQQNKNSQPTAKFYDPCRSSITTCCMFLCLLENTTGVYRPNLSIPLLVSICNSIANNGSPALHRIRSHYLINYLYYDVRVSPINCKSFHAQINKLLFMHQQDIRHPTPLLRLKCLFFETKFA